MTSTGSPRCSAATCVSSSCLLGGKIEANSIEPGHFLQKATKKTVAMQTFFTCHNTQHYVAHLIFESIPEVVKPLSLCPPRGGLPGSRGCQASSLARHSPGMVWPKQHGLATPSGMQSLLLKPPSIGSCRSARC